MHCLPTLSPSLSLSLYLFLCVRGTRVSFIIKQVWLKFASIFVARFSTLNASFLPLPLPLLLLLLEVYYPFDRLSSSRSVVVALLTVCLPYKYLTSSPDLPSPVEDQSQPQSQSQSLPQLHSCSSVCPYSLFIKQGYTHTLPLSLTHSRWGASFGLLSIRAAHNWIY